MKLKASKSHGFGCLVGALILTGCGGGGGSFGGSTGSFGGISYDIVGTAQTPVNRYSTTVAFSGISGATFANYIYRDYASQPIVYAGLEGGSSQIYGMNTSSGQRTTFSDTAGLNFLNPEPSVDGSTIYSSIFTGGSWFIASVDFDTGSTSQFNPGGANYRDMGVSPKGDVYAFSSDVDGNYEIYLQSFGSGSPTKLTDTSAGVVNSDPCFSADGRFIYFVSNRDGNNEIYRFSIFGSTSTRLTNNSSDDVEPSVSPNGQHVVWATNRDGNYEIYRMVAQNGSTATRLTSNVFSDREPTFSLDGTKIFFASDRDDTAPPVSTEIYSMTTTGGSPTRIPVDSSYDQKSPKQAPAIRYNLLNMGFPTATAGYIAGLNNSALQSILTFKTTDPTDANNGLCRVESDVQPSIAVPVIFYTITSPVTIQEIAFTTPGVTFRPLITKINPASSVEALVAFSASGPRAGQVLYVAPYNANRSRLTRKSEGDRATAEGTFTAIYDSTGKNIAPNGASKVVTDSSGEIQVIN